MRTALRAFAHPTGHRIHRVRGTRRLGKASTASVPNNDGAVDPAMVASAIDRDGTAPTVMMKRP